MITPWVSVIFEVGVFCQYIILECTKEINDFIEYLILDTNVILSVDEGHILILKKRRCKR
jgi:hypothetical protein